MRDEDENEKGRGGLVRSRLNEREEGRRNGGREELRRK